MWKIIFFVCFILLDQASKLAAIKRLHQNDTIPVINNIFHLTLVYNTGSAFGLLRNQNWILAYLSIVAIVVILFCLIRRRPGFSCNSSLEIWRFALLLILSGATGNLIDRLRLGYVIDFLDFRFWPVFNFADTMISLGVILLIYVLFKKEEVN